MKLIKLFFFLSVRKLAVLLGKKKPRSAPLRIAYCSITKADEQSVNEIVDWYLPIEKELSIFGKEDVIPEEKFDLVFIASAELMFSGWFWKNAAVTYLVDPDFYSFYEVANWLAASSSVLEPNAAGKSREIFADLYKQFNGRHAVLFGTGPGISDYKDFLWRDSQLKIICNSIIKNDRFLLLVRPTVLVIADPLFHFGYSAYAKKYRETMYKAWEEYKFYIALPAEYAALLLKHYPALHDYTLALKGVHQYCIPEIDALRVKKTDNILTYLMLPLALAFSERIRLIGFDGKADKQDKVYFWEHESDFQFTELMENAKECHPSFFRDRNYPGYYKRHVKVLTRYIEHAHRRGVYFKTLSKSHIPALAKYYHES